MNYRHAFHAGNFADVFKHCLLVGLLESLKGKQAPFCFLDTHAGCGVYDLQSPEAERTREFEQGVAQLLPVLHLPGSAHVYLNLVRALNSAEAANQGLRFYPGSPRIASLLCREQDRLVLCELKDTEVSELRRHLRHDARVHIHRRDGYEALSALVPPPERRGLVLIDPPFEAEDEFDRIRSTLTRALARWSTGVYAVWYPIKHRRTLMPFLRWLDTRIDQPCLLAELLLHPDDSALRLNGCGMAIINPPYRFDQLARELLPALHRTLAGGRFGRWSVQVPGEQKATKRS